ncbi:hypothetical protein NLG97_g5934 [Lecanicillium saksenae]|uniref:Uncharacterized protein n=1 Tax=Lecanicillium saksenae TaxID=468837 RepID=A0ACC1QS77_9HYPO|nr:hypothetical protein NLG97_g5934 [Lecanicillium saksenae]
MHLSVVATVAALLTGAGAYSVSNDNYECPDVHTSWGYWWYGANRAIFCPDGAWCSLGDESSTVRESYTYGIWMDDDMENKLATTFASSYHLAAVNNKRVTGQPTVSGPGRFCVWGKQWFAVTNAKCGYCRLGMCGGYEDTSLWMPCTDISCFEAEVSDADGRCEFSNNCQ